MGFFDKIFRKDLQKKETISLVKEVDNKSDSMAFFKKSTVCVQHGDYNTALEYLSEAIKLCPNNPNNYMYRGKTYEEIGNVEGAKRDYLKTLALSPDSCLAAFKLGMIYSSEYDIENAIKLLNISYCSAIEMGVPNSAIHATFNVTKKAIAYNLGNVLAISGRLEDALKYLDASIIMDPNYSKPLITKGAILGLMGSPEEGLKFIKKASILGDVEAPPLLQLLSAQIRDNPSKNNSNPLNIIDDPQLNRIHRLPNLVDAFKNDLLFNSRILMKNIGYFSVPHLLILAVYYTIDSLIDYKNNADVLPMSIISDFKHQITEALRNETGKNLPQDLIDKMYAQIDKKIWEINIVTETREYMKQFE